MPKKSAKLDDIEFDKLVFFLSVRRALQGGANAEDIGLLDAINDSLQVLGVLDSSKTFLDSFTN